MNRKLSLFAQKLHIVDLRKICAKANHCKPNNQTVSQRNDNIDEREEGRNLPILYEVFKILEEIAYDFLLEHIAQNYWRRYTDDIEKAPSILRSKGAKRPNHIWHFLDDFGDKICTGVLGVESGFYSRKEKEAVNDLEKPISFRSTTLDNHLVNMGMKNREDDLIDSLMSFINDLYAESRIPGIVFRSQKLLLENVTDDIPREDEVELSDLTALTTLYTSRLVSVDRKGEDVGTKWFLYIYGYDLLDSPKEAEGTWPLVRLVLTFGKKKNEELSVFIRNTRNPRHYHYIGETDFETSSSKVLVMNLRTKSKPRRRQLNIKMLMNSAEGSFFVGQYSNYEVKSGRIFSGIAVMEMITKDDKHPLPSTYSIPDLGDYGESLREVMHVIPFFEDRAKAFFDVLPYAYELSTEEKKIGSSTIVVKKVQKKELT